MARVGYTRVSTIDQNLDRQLDGIPVFLRLRSLTKEGL